MVILFHLISLIIDPRKSGDKTDPTRNIPQIYIDINQSNKKPLQKTAFKIRFDLSPLESSYADPSTCYSESGTVTYGQEKFSCSGNSLNESQKKQINKTFEEISNFLSTLLLSEKIGKELNVPASDLNADSRDFKFKDVIVKADEDILINVYSKPHSPSSGVLAAAAALLQITTNSKPVFGLIILNPRQVPTSDPNNRFFWIALHETLHALGISSSTYDSLHPPDSNTKYSSTYKRKFNSGVICQIKQSETITRYFLITPYAHAFAKRQYGTDTFTIGDSSCPAGIELENLGGSGTALAHPKNSMFFSDVMSGVIRQEPEDKEFLRLTTATAAWLLDTGIYEINWESGHVKELLWGYKETFLSGQTPTGYPVGAKQNMFPEHYGWSTKYHNSFDFKYYSPKNVQNFIISLNDLKSRGDSNFLTNLNYFNPQNKEYFGDQFMDYLAYVFPRENCTDKQIAVTTEDGAGACVAYECDENYKLTIGEQKIQVTTEGSYQVNGMKYILPNGEYICRTMKHSGPLTTNPFANIDFNYLDNWKSPNDGSYTDNTKVSTSRGAIIGVSTVVAVLAVAGIAYFIYKKFAR